MEVIDSIAGFLTWYDSVQDFSDQDKVSSFKSTVYPLDPIFYDHRFKDLTAKGQDPDAKIIDIINEFDSIRDRFAFFYTTLTQNLATGLTLLNQSFPDFNIDIPFHICHSFGECDGRVSQLHGSLAMILGIDVMAKLHT